MNRSVTQALANVDVVLLVVEAGRFGEADRRILPLLPQGKPVILVINKVDRLTDKKLLLPLIAEAAREYEFAEIVPMSAERGTGAAELLKAAGGYLPEGQPLFGEDELTDRSERFLAAEFLREKLFRRLGEELPYAMTVEIERFETEGRLRRIHAAIIVDKDNHKAMVIGKGGEGLKVIASEARKDMERLFGGKVFLEVWVKVKGGWADDERALKSLGYD
jgi:GTP-binding protein Era